MNEQLDRVAVGGLLITAELTSDTRPDTQDTMPQPQPHLSNPFASYLGECRAASPLANLSYFSFNLFDGRKQFKTFQSNYAYLKPLF